MTIMSNYIKVSNLNNNIVWEKQQLSNIEYQQVANCIYGRGTVAIIPATLIPVRTNTMKNFAKDFFLPTTFNHALKVQHVVGKVFAVLASLVLDLLTFPVRLLTCIPRVISNSKCQEIPLLKYLKDQQVDSKVLESDYVRVELGWETRSQCPTSSWTDNDGTKHSEYSQDKHWQKQNVNFIELPIYEDSDYSESGIG